jgi:hypothetical protein
MTDLSETPTASVQPSSTFVTPTQRAVLLDLLDQESGRLNQHADALHRELVQEAKRYAVASDMPDFDRRCSAVDLARRQADTIDDLLGILETATRPVAAPGPVAAVSNALVGAFADGGDVGAVLVAAVADAQRTVFLSTEEWLTSNRPGSWEAALLSNIIESSGWKSHAS